VDALQRAIAVLRKQAHDRAQKASLTQVSALKNLNLIPDQAKSVINAFLSTATFPVVADCRKQSSARNHFLGRRWKVVHST